MRVPEELATELPPRLHATRFNSRALSCGTPFEVRYSRATSGENVSSSIESNRPLHAGVTRHAGRGSSRLERIVRTLSPSEGRKTCLSHESRRRKDS